MEFHSLYEDVSKMEKKKKWGGEPRRVSAINCLKPFVMTCSSNPLTWFVFFHWSLVALQCCVSFYCTAKWIIYIYISPLLDFLRVLVTAEHWVDFPVLYSGFSLSILYTVSIVYVCQFQYPNSPTHPPFPLWYPYVCSVHLYLYFWFVNRLLIPCFSNSMY